MKYISFEVDGAPNVITITFPDVLVHKHVASAMVCTIRRCLDSDEVKVVSAGFCALKDVECWGDSETLGVESNPQRDKSALEPK
jgi:hypothetical protein